MKWVSMTTHLTSDLLTQLQPACGKITSVAQFRSVASDSKMRWEAQQKMEEEAKASGDADKTSEEPKLPHLDTIPGTEIRFSEIPKQKYPDGATPWTQPTYLIPCWGNTTPQIIHHFSDIPEDFFVDIVSTDNFLTATFQESFSNMEQGNGNVELRRRGLKFRDHLTRKFNWDFTSEPDDYAPVIVETNNK